MWAAACSTQAVGRRVGGVEGLMKAEPAGQLSGTTCPTITLCLFSGRGSLDPSLTTAAELPPSPLSTYFHYYRLCFFFSRPSLHPHFFKNLLSSLLVSSVLSSSFFQWLSLSTDHISLSDVHFTLGCFTSSADTFNSWCWILKSNFRTIVLKTFTSSIVFNNINTEKETYKLIIVPLNQCNWCIWGGKVSVLDPWNIWSALIRTLSHTSQSYQQLSGLKPVHVDHISHYSHSCHVNGGGLHCCGTAGHCLHLSVRQGDVKLLDNCYEVHLSLWGVMSDWTDTRPHRFTVVMFIAAKL